MMSSEEKKTKQIGRFGRKKNQGTFKVLLLNRITSTASTCMNFLDPNIMAKKIINFS